MINHPEQILQHNPHNIPNFLSGHWESEEGFKVALIYSEYTEKNLCMGHLPDAQIAEGLRTSDSLDLKLIAWQTAAKERIRWLSVKLAIDKMKNPQNHYPTELGGPDRNNLFMDAVSDFQIANLQFMTGRDDTKLPELKIAAAQRILWLSKQLRRL